MNPAALVHLQPEMLSRYAQAPLPATPCAAPAERKWAGVACVAVLALAPLLIALAT
ncbi:hypothetical protein [Azohydromonas aeria]|uniref:hypothetical protein n=1 Tax=Azohydromonas aeria TaxID=2590212 RepID=UPI0012FA1F88|nr:hypothetical protein [Azohydromonas aeria]